jgi:hypothetical protein
MKELIQKVRAIDEAAAQWLRTQAPKLPSFDSTAESLNTVMRWRETPQGWAFWANIWRQLP